MEKNIKHDKKQLQEEKFAEKKEFIDFVRCKCILENGETCNWPDTRISGHILKHHNLTTKQYKEKFNAPVVCSSTSEKTSFKGKHSEETKKLMSKSRTGKVPWNAGLTKYDSLSIKSIADKAKIRLSKKENNNWSTNPLQGDRNGMFGKTSWRKNLTKDTSELIESAEEKSSGIQHHKSNFCKNTTYNTNKFVFDFASQQMQKIRNTDKKCIMCEETEKLQVHHIIPRYCFDAYDLDAHLSRNLITLCNKHHSSYGQSLDKAIINTNDENELKQKFPKEYKIYKDWINYTQKRLVSCLPIDKKIIEQLDEKTRRCLAETIFEELRCTGFPFPVHTEEVLLNDLFNVENSASCIRLENNILRNYNTSGSKIREHFVKEQYSNFIDIFNDDKQLLKVIKNRLGLDWKTKPEFFNMNYKIIIKGFEVLFPDKRYSKYKPTTAKWIIDNFCKSDTVFDYSAGWGDRMLGTVAAKRNYLGVDTNRNLIPELKNSANWLMNKRKSKIEIINDSSTNYIGNMEFAYSCPPYGAQEIYEGSNYSSDKNWLQSFMIPVINMCNFNLSINGIFVCHLPVRLVSAVKNELDTFFKEIANISVPNRHDAYHDGDERINEVILVYQKNVQHK